jgi:hypothetical protein
LLGPPLGSNFGYRSCDLSLEFFCGHIPKGLSELLEDLEALGALTVEPVQPPKILGRNNPRHRDPALLDHDAGLMAVDPVYQTVELLLDLGDLHRLGRRLLAHVVSLQSGLNGIKKDLSAPFEQMDQSRGYRNS